MKIITVVIPALNEQDGIASTINAIPRRQLESMGYGVQVLVVDNGSSDETGERAQKAGAEVVFEPKRGYGSAFKAGFASAKGDVIATVDSQSSSTLKPCPPLHRIIISPWVSSCDERNCLWLS